MSAVVWAAPYLPPSPPVAVNPFPGLTLTWTGANGDEFNLANQGCGIVLVGDSVEGMHLPEFEDYVQEFAGLDGQDYDGGVAKPRHVEWTMLIFCDASSDGWLANEKRWWASFKPRGSYGTWAVADQNGGTRRLKCRLTSDGGYAHQNDPARFGWAAYPITLIADDPWWYGEPIVGSWTPPEPKMLFGGGTLGVDPMRFPPLYHSSANTFSSATITNPGDEPTWAKWTVSGPIDSATFTVDGGSIGLPAVAAGETLVVNTDPADPTAFLDDVDVSGLVEPWDPRPFPPGETVPVTLDVDYDEGASVQVEAPTKYWRAFA